MIPLQCAICGNKQHLRERYPANYSTKKITAKIFSARRTPDKMHFRFMECNNCGLVFSTPILPPKDLQKLYSNSTFDYSSESSYLKYTYGKYLEKALGSTSRKKLHLLDIGCGNGFFLEEAAARGVGHVFGIEPGKPSVDKAPKWLKKNIKTGFFTAASYKANTFDIVCCFQTLDHIVDPNTFLKSIYKVLKKDGKALCILHDTEGLSVKVLGEKSPIFDIEHMYLFNKKNLAQIFTNNKFKVVDVFSVENTYPLSYWSRMLPLSSSIKQSLTNVFSKAPQLDISVTVRAGNMGIIVQK